MSLSELFLSRIHLWHAALSKQHWHQILFFWYVLCSQVTYFQIPVLLIGLVNLLYNFEMFFSFFLFFLICLRGAVTEANKDEQGCLGPKECKYVIMDRYNNNKKPEFSQQARRGSNYQLSVDNRLLQETWRVHEQLWGLHSGMLLRPLSTSSSWGENYSFWRPRRRY